MEILAPECDETPGLISEPRKFCLGISDSSRTWSILMTWSSLVNGLGGFSKLGIVSFSDSHNFKIVFSCRMVSETTLRLFQLFLHCNSSPELTME